MTKRQLQCIQLAADGKQTKEIAYILDISVNTVKVHLHKLNQLIGAETKSHAVAICLRTGKIK